jgi:hypothetical protein
MMKPAYSRFFVVSGKGELLMQLTIHEGAIGLGF